MTYEGRAWILGDDVNTDMIIPGRYLDRYDPKHLAAHALEGVRPEFASGVKQGDIVIAGTNFGCGSSREQAVTALKEAGVSVVVAKSFSRIFYRNSVNLGLWVLSSGSAADVFQDGDAVIVDLAASVAWSSDGKRSAPVDPVPERAAAILRAGGLVPFIKATVNR